MSAPEPTDARIRSLTRLAEKYARLRTLRAVLPSSASPRALTLDERALLRALAADFPGALRELDILATDEIEERHRQISDWLAQPLPKLDPPRWMGWMARYHQLMSQALAVRAAARVRATQPADWAAWCAEHEIDFVFAGAALAPPGGRVMAAVFAALSAESGAPESELWNELFPLRGGARSYRRSFPD